MKKSLGILERRMYGKKNITLFSFQDELQICEEDAEKLVDAVQKATMDNHKVYQSNDGSGS